MKKKKIKKIAKEIFKYVEKGRQPKEERYNLSEYNQEISEKFKNLINHIIQYCDDIKVYEEVNKIVINVEDIDSIKNESEIIGKKLNNTLNITIEKDKGFLINKNYNKVSNYKDKKIYNELYPIIKSKIEKNNKDNFNHIVDEILYESGLIRDLNLSNIINDEE